MPERNLDQRLLAILAADVAGYSRLMEANERATVNALDAARAVFRDHAAAHRGRIVDTAGDSVLAVFPSAIGAVQAALAIQDELGDRNETVLEEQRMHFRIGVNLGDVIEKDDGSVYGSGVNVAARLESLAAPGGIMISEDVHRQVMGKVTKDFEDAGTHAVKNIAKPVQAFRVITESGPDASPSVDKPFNLPDKPSIAVLPFDNLSRDADQEYFADGIAEDLITALSRIRWMFVTARNSSFAYKGQSPDVRHVGRELGVRYVLEGSVRKGGNRLRISAKLIDASTGNYVWAERYDRELVDLFDLQDEITEALVATLQTEVGQFESERAHRKAPQNLDAWECYQRGMWHLWRASNAENLAEACGLFQRAIDLDPNFAQPVAALANTLYLQIVSTYVESPIETLNQALQFANRAIALDDKEALAHHALGRIQTTRGEFELAIETLRTAINLNPSLALAHYALGNALLQDEQLGEAVIEYDTAIRLSPRDPLIFTFYQFRAVAQLLLGDYEASVRDAQRAVLHPAAASFACATLASGLALLDRHVAAKTALDKLLEVRPEFDPYIVLASFSPLNPKALRPLYKPWVDGLRKAGLAISE
jgi:TolB-like protein/class 3 adenylate cyclase